MKENKGDDEREKVTPWEVSGDIDYEKLVKEFGISPLTNIPASFNENIFFFL